MNPEELKKRTKAMALRIVRLTESLPKTRGGEVMGRQLLRCGTSVGANYRAACRAKSQADFILKMKFVEEECDETVYWLELITESGMIEPGRVSDLMKEANELLSITVASLKTARHRR